MTYLIIGGTGYIGSNLAVRLRSMYPSARIVVSDIGQPRDSSFEFVKWDVREAAPTALILLRPDWIFNLAAIHREPGHEREEYFDTNIPGARNVCDLAEKTECRNLFFTSSIAVYGPTRGETSEDSPKYPTTGYGISKLVAEGIHETWRCAGPGRKLVICRPGVIYGPGEAGNIPRMVKAIKKGIFFFPGDKNIIKSYGYIEGLLDSITFASGLSEMKGSGPGTSIYNYVETPTEPLISLANAIAVSVGKKEGFASIPLWVLVLAASVLQVVTGGRSPLHPARVRKAATPTHIDPKFLRENGFCFRYPFAKSLIDWKAKAPSDFS